ncbi:TetR/AcrR family transcriptional regulator [Paenibacillus sp. sgz500958]|uniref:TetR/AcrR family transcriptional regulator n=1 Tax=Paenibacillus sp. sgz500958 TaxID=3242475 RepID=UPI0036D32016
MARSKEFDVDTVLGKAMEVFWRQGYEKTSMQDLVHHMGIHKRSMYDTFGDKHKLYMQVMDRYKETMQHVMEHRTQNQSSAKSAIRQLFEVTIHKAESEPKGCLIVNTAVELSQHDPEAADKVADSLLDTENLLRILIRKGQESGEFSQDLDEALVSEYLNNALVGLRVMVKTTRDTSKLNRIMETTLSILD